MGGLGPGIGGAEWLVLGIVALLVVGPERLPGLLRELGKWLAKARGMANEFRASFEDMARQSELDELRKEVQALRSTNPVDLGPEADATFRDIRSEFQKPLFDAAAPGPDASAVDLSDPVMTPAPTEWPVDTGVVVDTTVPLVEIPEKKRASKPRVDKATKAIKTTKVGSAQGSGTPLKKATRIAGVSPKASARNKATDL